MKKIYLLIILLLISWLLAGEEDHENAAVHSDLKIGIALSGGGVRGFAHIGVLRRLEEEGIKPYMLSGSSMGAMIAGMYCLGYNTYQIEKMVRESDTQEIFSNKPDRDMTENYIKKTSDRTVVELELTESGIQLPNALNNGHKVLKKIRSYANSSEYCCNDFDNLKYKLRIICSDIQNSKKVIFRDGDLPLIILGSMSFPGLFKPVVYKDLMLLDGGLTDNIPVGVLDDCDIVIASNTTHDSPSKSKDYNFIELLDRISILMTKSNIEMSLENAEIVLRPDVENISVTELNDPDSLIKLGYLETERKILEIRELLKGNESKTQKKASRPADSHVIVGNTSFNQKEIADELKDVTYADDAVSSVRKFYINRGFILCSVTQIRGEKDTLKINEGKLKSIRITGDTFTRKKFIREELSVSTSKSLKLDDLENSVDNLYSTGLFDKVNYEIDRDKCEVTFFVEEKPYRLIRLGANYQTDKGFLGLIEIANKNVYGKRAEVYAGLTFGESFNRFELSHYNPFMLRSTLFFEVMPYYQVKDRNFYDQKHEQIESLRYKEERYGAGLNLGFQIFDNYQGMFSIVQEFIDNDSELNERTSGIFRILADSRNDNVVPSKGVFFSWNIETGMYDFDNLRKYQKTWWEFSGHTNIFRKMNIALGVSGGTGDNLVPYNERYLIGGINMMPGTFFEEYSVIQYFRVKNRYDLLIKDSAFFDLYFSCAYFLNAFWNDEPEIEWSYRKFLSSFYSGIILNTKLAPVEAGVAVTAGNGTVKSNSRVFLSVGYPLQ